jgi:MYXO-CTERM domain-containing protein
MRNLLGGLLALAAIASAPSGARADIAPSGQAECDGKKPGDKCKLDGAAGTCEATKCTRPDYSKGPPPTYRSVDCVLCRPTKKSEAESAAPMLAAGVGLVLLGGALALRRRRDHAGDRGHR